jgi:hypothetical protein
MNAKSFGTFFALMLLAACGDTTTDQGPGGISAEDAKALDVAADKLDAETKSAEK